MVNYQCQRCGHETKKKSDIKVHMNRKNLCKPILNDVSPSYIDISKVPHKCSNCDFVTIYKDRFDEHIESCLTIIKMEQINNLQNT